MLEVTIVLQPKGDSREPQELYKLQIVNDMSGTEEKGNYQITLLSRSVPPVRDRVVGVHRNKGLAHLVSACLLAVGRHIDP